MWLRRRADNDFQAEIESHIRLETDRLIGEGLPPEEARATARRAFGNIAAAQEEFYELRRWLWWRQLVQDLRFGLRSLRRSPAFTAAVALTVALGVGANTAIFSLIDAVLLRSLPVQNAKELVFVQAAGRAGPSGAPPYPCFARLRAETHSFTGMAASSSDELRIEIEGQPEQVVGQVASGNYFELLGIRPVLGRVMNAEDEKLDPPVAVISERYWQRRFGGDPRVIGKTIVFRGQAFTIAGVTPAEFRGLQPGTAVDVTLPITIERQLLSESGDWWIQAIVARLAPGVSGRQAQAEANVVFHSFMLDSRLPADQVREHFARLELQPAAHGMDVLRRRFSKPLYVLMAIVGLVLLMAALNIANLLLARGIARRREFAIRLATGAGRMRLVRQLLTETLLLFALGAIPGVILAGWGAGLIEAVFAQGRRPIRLAANLNWQVLIFAIAVTLAAGLLAGLFPAWRAFRTDPERAIKEGQLRAGESRGSAMLTRTLVAFQVALSLVLLVTAVTFLRTLTNLRQIDPGFRDEQVLTMSVELPDGRMAGKSTAVWSGVLEAVRRIPGIRAAGVSTFTPLSGRDRRWALRVRGYEPLNSEDGTIHVNQISEGYFETLGISLLRGRLPAERDTEGTPRIAVINEAAARKYFRGRDPIGQNIEFLSNGTVDSIYRVAGVVRDTKHMNLREAAPPFVFVPIRQAREAERRVTLSVASGSGNGPSAYMAAIRGAITKVNPALLISEVITIRSQLDSTLLAERLLSGLSSAFGLLALLLAAVGLNGVLSYRIGRERQSIGIRMALGASRPAIILDVVRQGGLLILAGLLGGLPFAILSAHAADSMLWGVSSSDPAIYIAGGVLLSLVGLISAYLPARRASAIEPAEALRYH